LETKSKPFFEVPRLSQSGGAQKEWFSLSSSYMGLFFSKEFIP